MTADETSAGRLPLHPLEHSADPEPGNTAGGPGLGAVSQLPDRQGAVWARLLFIREQQEHGPGDTGADHGGAGRGTHFDKLRPCVRPKPSAALLDEYPRRGTAGGSGPYPVGRSGKRPAAP